MVAARVRTEAVPFLADISSLMMQGLSYRTVDVVFPLDCVGACGFPDDGVCRDLQLEGSLRPDRVGLVEQYGAFDVLR